MKKILATVLVSVLAVSCLAGCGAKGGKGGNDSTTVQIRYWNSGLGTEWLDAVIAAFEEKYPEYKVEYSPSADPQAVKAPFGNEKTDETDLYMANTEMDFEYTESLDDVLDSKVEGESKTIREKFDDAYLANEVAKDGKIYELTYGGGYNCRQIPCAYLPRKGSISARLHLLLKYTFLLPINTLYHIGG